MNPSNDASGMGARDNDMAQLLDSSLHPDSVPPPFPSAKIMPVSKDDVQVPQPPLTMSPIMGGHSKTFKDLRQDILAPPFA